MEEKILPKEFFRNHPLDEISAAGLAYAEMTTELDTLLSQKDGLSGKMNSRHRALIEQERENIAHIENAEAVVSFMRKNFDLLNQALLVQKALSMEEQVLPLLLRRYQTSFQDVFVETAANVIVRAEERYSRQLMERYPTIRNPYAMSLACLIFGVKKLENAAPLLLAEYERMKKEYRKENLCQGPLLGLYVLYGK